MVKLKAGDKSENRRILKELYEEHGKAVRCFLYKRVKNREDIDDIVQDLFVRISKQKDLKARLEGGVKQQRAYLFTIANNLVVDMERNKLVRWRYSIKQGEQAKDYFDDLSPDVVVIAREHLKLVKQAIKELKPNHRTAFVLSRFKHMSHKEIAEVMGVKSRQVESYVASAVTNLRKKVDQMYQGGFGQDYSNES
ncbi:sigma-70 family RNA polymerase sigma factor [Porticoccaceae bacterium LTM1]|nr:sigma-70 family RNA polymerase sigma factor [Porticoccaceae bacterium LTM1]